MTVERPQRRIDRVTEASLVDSIAELPTVSVRRLRDDCREEESRLSYLRRLLQGRLDIARAEDARRREKDTGDLLGALPGILADTPSSARRDPRSVAMYIPPEGGRRQDDQLLADAALGRLPDLSDEELIDLVARLEAEEHRVSRQRALVLAHLDALQAELVARYRDGRADVSEVVSLQEE